ncbi:M20/M25/M40 family metallo-hydrolase [Sulfitobacter delicatus]|uniref:M20/M25/M40 family metallo-hydrolase n=1 Tax=Sulfitobacter delicatus TaxID=218672 RepID=UPI00313423E0
MILGSEDFSHFLQHRPGCFVRLGNGERSAPLHNPAYDFGDKSLTTGAAFWTRLTERFLTENAGGET